MDFRTSMPRSYGFHILRVNMVKISTANVLKNSYKMAYAKCRSGSALFAIPVNILRKNCIRKVFEILGHLPYVFNFNKKIKKM